MPSPSDSLVFLLLLLAYQPLKTMQSWPRSWEDCYKDAEINPPHCSISEYLDYSCQCKPCGGYPVVCVKPQKSIEAICNELKHFSYCNKSASTSSANYLTTISSDNGLTEQESTLSLEIVLPVSIAFVLFACLSPILVLLLVHSVCPNRYSHKLFSCIRSGILLCPVPTADPTADSGKCEHLPPPDAATAEAPLLAVRNPDRSSPWPISPPKSLPDFVELPAVEAPEIPQVVDEKNNSGEQCEFNDRIV